MRIYEINTRTFCDRFDQITQDQLSRLVQLGFDAIWPMGAWRISEGARKISRTMSADYDGSPYALADYQLSPQLGGIEAYQIFRTRANAAGLKVLLDFIPNHMALDSDWIAQDSNLFIKSDPTVRKQDPSEFFLHSSGEVIAHGKDPYFPPWYDTAQLDYTSPALRARQIDVLRRISKIADGVRCDMAMLILRDYFHQRWYPEAPADWFNKRMPSEFWSEAVSATKEAAPGFTFLAEAYWDKEPELQSLGFDLTYEKGLYDALVARSASRVYERLRQPDQTLKSSLFFIENHDEPRAASVFTQDENIAAMALVLSTPGSALVYQGQIEGLKERLPIQLRHVPPGEKPDEIIRQAYEKLLRATSGNVFKNGSFRLFSSQAPDVVSVARYDSQSVAAYIGQIGGPAERFAGSVLDVTPLAEMVRATTILRLTDILRDVSVSIRGVTAGFKLVPASLGITPGTRFCLLRAESV